MREGRNQNRKSMPSLKRIHEYWSFENKRLYEKENFWWVSDCFDDGEPRCYACGSLGVERCHIQAVSVGGDNSVGNLHLLCSSCHAKSEMLEGEPYWLWIINTPIMSTVERFCWDFGMKFDVKKEGIWDDVHALAMKVIPDLMAKNKMDIHI